MANASQLPCVKVILLTKDERDMIVPFLTYYGELLGYDNVVVVDNGSTDPDVLAHYVGFGAKGVQVRLDARPFPAAVDFMSEHMRSLVGTCKWIMPLETDEFLFVMPRVKDLDYVVTGADVMGYLDALPDDVSIVRYGAFYGSVVDSSDAAYVKGAYPHPPKDMTRFYDQNWDKIVVRADRFDRMAQWCHRASVSRGSMLHSDYIGLLHYHETGFRRQLESAIRVIKGFGYVDFDATPAQQLASNARILARGVACGHKLEYYDMALRRRVTVAAFKAVAGRLPFSVEELDRYTKCPDPETAVKRDAASILSTPPPNGHMPSIDELLFHEKASVFFTPCIATFDVHQVARFFKRG